MAVTVTFGCAADLGAPSADRSTAELLVNGLSMGTFITPRADEGWGGYTVDITDEWDVASDNLITMVYTTGLDTYHVRDLRVSVDGGADNYGEYPEGFAWASPYYTSGLSANRGQAEMGAGTATEWSMETLAEVGGLANMKWYFTAPVTTRPRLRGGQTIVGELRGGQRWI